MRSNEGQMKTNLSLYLKEKFWCIASWEWAVPRRWCWRIWCSITTCLFTRPYSASSRNGPYILTKTFWRCCWIWTYRGRENTERVSCCEETPHHMMKINLLLSMIIIFNRQLSYSIWTNKISVYRKHCYSSQRVYAWKNMHDTEQRIRVLLF